MSELTVQLTQAERSRLDEAEEGVNASNLELCRVMSEMPDKQVAIAEYTGRSKPVVSQMIAVGQSYEKFASGKHLPDGWRSLYELTSLNKTQVRHICKDGPPTRKQIAEYKIELGLLAPPADKLPISVGSIEEALLDKMFDMAGLNEFAAKAIVDSKKHILKLWEGMSRKMSEDTAKLIVAVFKHNAGFINREIDRQVKIKTREKQEELTTREEQIKARERQMVNGIPEKDKKYVYNVIHPDKAPEGMEAKYTKAFDIVRKWH